MLMLLKLATQHLYNKINDEKYPATQLANLPETLLSLLTISFHFLSMVIITD